MGEITDRQMNVKPSDKDIWINESAPKGHGRFIARIMPSGDRLFYFRYTTSEGKRVRLPIGAYDRDGTSGISLKVARQRARELATLYLAGTIDLREHLEAEEAARIAGREAEMARLAADKAKSIAEAHYQAARKSVNDLFEHWAKIDLINRKDGGAEVRRMFKKDVLPTLGKLAVADVKKGHIVEVTDALLARGVNRMAKQIFSLIRQMFRFAVDRDLIEHDPSASIRKAKIGGKDTERDRVLSEDEITHLVKMIPDAGLLVTTQAAVWIALSTCCRIGELLGAHWEHMDLDKGIWLIPAENSKNGKPLTVYLSPFAARQFQRLREINGGTQWCYPNRDKSGSVSSKTVTKQLGDRQRKSDQTIITNRSSKSSALLLPGGKWTPHDLRRTGATIMTALGVLPEVADRCLNHTEENKLKRIYQHHTYAKEMAAAWSLLGERLELLSRPDIDNVVMINRA